MKNDHHDSAGLNAAVPEQDGLRADETMFMALFATHPSVMLIVDAGTGRVVDANHAATQFYGWPVEEFRKLNLHDIDVPPPADGTNSPSLLAALKQGRTSRAHRKADGSLRDVELFASPAGLPAKNMLFVIVQDISERKDFESLTEFRLRLLEMSETGSTEELLTFTLDEAERLTGSTLGFFNFISDDQSVVMRHACSSCAKKDNCGEASHPNQIDPAICADVITEKRAVIHNDHATLRHCNSRFVDHQQAKRELIVPIIRNGKVMATMEIGNKPIDYRDEDVRLISVLAGVAWDIIARKYAEESERKMQKAIQYTQKMELIGQLAGGIAHDINNVLMAILGHAELMIDELDEWNPFSESLLTIQESAVRATNLIQQLLAFARKQMIQPTLVELDEEIDKQKPMLREITGDRVRIEWILGSNHARVLIDPSQLDQILTNLCANARDAIEGAGKVTIETSTVRVEAAECYAGHPCQTPGNYVTISVTDNGCGIDSNTLPHIFEPFFTTREVGKGTGLGLSTVYGIVRQNKGYLECQSSPGCGARFTIYLLRHDDSPEPHGNTSAGVSETRKAWKTILLVDDDPSIVALIRTVLTKHDYAVLTATTPRNAERIAAASDNEIALLLTDVVMPEMNGRELSARVQAIHPHLKTLFMSAFTMETIAMHGVTGSETNFIRKPFKISTLLQVIQKILG